MIKNLLLLRGWTRTQGHWGDFPGRLKRHLPKLSLHFLDLPGFGTEAHRPSPRSIWEIADHLRRSWLDRDPSSREKAGLLGISMGAMIAMNWGERYPEDFENFILINPSAADLSPFYDRLNLFQIDNFLRAALAPSLKAREEQVLRICVNQKLEELPYEPASFSKLQAMNQLIAASRFRAPRSWSKPTLVLSSIQDRLVAARAHHAVAFKLRASVISHPEAGHDLPLEDPDWTANAIKEWLVTTD